MPYQERLRMADSILPRCKTDYPHYISAEGQWFPCCFVSQHSEHSDKDWFFQNREDFNLNKKSLEEVLKSEKLQELEQLWRDNDGRGAPHWCQVKCRVQGKPSP